MGESIDKWKRHDILIVNIKKFSLLDHRLR